MSGVGGKSKSGLLAALALVSAMTGYADQAGAAEVPNISWSLSGESTLHAPAEQPSEAPIIGAPPPPRRSAAQARPAAKAIRTAVKRPVIAPPSKRPAAMARAVLPQQVRPAAKPPARPRVIQPPVIQPRVALPVPARQPPQPVPVAKPVAAPIAVQPVRIAPPPVAVEAPGAELVTVQPPKPQATAPDEGSFGQSVTAAAQQTRGFQPLRLIVGVGSLAAALSGLAALWWQSVGARLWSSRRRKIEPRRMIDIELADRAKTSEPPALEVGFPRENAA